MKQNLSGVHSHYNGVQRPKSLRITALTYIHQCIAISNAIKQLKKKLDAYLGSSKSGPEWG